MSPLFFIGAIALAFALYMLQYTLRMYFFAKSSKCWPCVPGTLIEMRLVKWQATSNERTLFVKYEYRVDGKAYFGRRIAFYTLACQEALGLEAMLRAKKHVPIYYDPDYPGSATIVTGPRTEKTYSEITLAAIFLAACIALFAFGLIK